MIDDEYQAIDRVQRWRDSGGWKLSVVYLCGYNPNLLLTDQRSELAKFAALHRPLGETYQPILTDPPYHRGGVFKPARRMGKTAAMQAVLPAGEHVIPISRLHRYGMGTKKLAEAYSGVGYSAQIAAVGVERFNERMKKFGDELARMQEKVYLRMLASLHPKLQPGDMFYREQRIANLLFSSDRRQKKRGNRLFDQWRNRRAGINWTRDEKRALLSMGYGRARQPLDYIEPEHYWKD